MRVEFCQMVEELFPVWRPFSRIAIASLHEDPCIQGLTDFVCWFEQWEGWGRVGRGASVWWDAGVTPVSHPVLSHAGLKPRPHHSAHDCGWTHETFRFEPCLRSELAYKFLCLCPCLMAEVLSQFSQFSPPSDPSHHEAKTLSKLRHRRVINCALQLQNAYRNNDMLPSSSTNPSHASKKLSKCWHLHERHRRTVFDS